MQVIEGRLLLSATDLSDFLACEHLAHLKRLRADGVDIPAASDDMTDLLSRMGAEHESAWLERYRLEGRSIKMFDDRRTLDSRTVAELESAAAETDAAMRQGYDVIYQPLFLDGAWLGRADFLLRVDTPSDLGAHSYEVADAKLARRVRAEALLQLCEYSGHAGRIQGLAPQWMHVLLGDQEDHPYLLTDYSAYHGAVRERLEEAVAAGFGATYPDRVGHCKVCRFSSFCDARRHADDHLSIVARMRGDQVRRLNAAGTMTVADLAARSAADHVPDMVDTTFEQLRRQAVLQHRGPFPDGTPRHELLEAHAPGFGLCALPSPDEGDVFFDMEGDPLARDQPLEYLFGAVSLENGVAAYRWWEGHDAAEEKRAFESFVDWLVERLQQHPRMHVYHYADYERAALQRLMSRHGTRENEVDNLLRQEVLVDLYRVVYQGVRLSTESYSLKDVERLYMPRRDESVADAAASMVRYERWRVSGATPETRDRSLLDGIIEYNRVDCESTLQLRAWLEERRTELEDERHEPLPRPAERQEQETPQEAQLTTQEEALRAALVEDLPPAAEDRDDEQKAQWLAAQLIGYHHRERRSQWWQFYRRLELTDEQLAEDRDAVGPLQFDATEEENEKHRIDRYTFEPQEQRVGEREVFDPHKLNDKGRRGASAGTVVDIDASAGVLLLKRNRRQVEQGHPVFLLPGTPVRTDAQEESLQRFAEDVLMRGLHAVHERRSAVRLLRRQGPSGPVRGEPLQRDRETPRDAALRLLEGSEPVCLAVQGPPGAGKTYLGAQIAIERSRHGAVAVTAVSHRAISNLLDEVCRGREQQAVRVGQRVDSDARCCADDLVVYGSNPKVDAALDEDSVDVVGGTSWLFSRPELAGRFDTLIIDEAGQLSLADAIAMSRCAKHLVLLGDPRQLPQVVQGIHPDGASAAALEHFLGDDITIAPDRGLFLERTRRMCPPLTAFVSDAFYQSRLQSEDMCAGQEVLLGEQALSGIRRHPVEHAGDRVSSTAEAECVRSVIDLLLTGRWRDAGGAEKPLTLDQILVVAPYNAHVACLRAHLPHGTRIGTVDKFQGQEAAVSIFSMATSSTDDLPRNLEFLFSMNRLNVAISRAKCLAVLVYSPRLTRARCRTPQQMRLLNALCRYEAGAPLWLQEGDSDDGSVTLAEPGQLLLAGT